MNPRPSASSSPARPRTEPGWHGALRSGVLPVLLALFAVSALLMAFFQVVQGAVQQGDTRRHASARQAQAAWRCPLSKGGSTLAPGLQAPLACDVQDSSP